ncbi:MAG: branched-chain amino acid aminotransferase [Planctomycetota bacterium]
MAPQIDWDKLTFSLTPTDTMFMATCPAGGTWDEGKFIPYGNFSISPAAGVLNYGQGLFEGLKAQQAADGAVVLFRPIENGKRLMAGAERLCMSPFPAERFVDVVKQVVKANRGFVPPMGKGALYVRPCLWGTGPILGVQPAPSYTLCIYVSPVGPYFKGAVTPIKIEVTKEYHRAAPRGTGGIKAIGNYAGSMYPAKKTKAKGFAEVIYLNAASDTFIEEVGAANFFCLKDGALHTPRLTGSILPGITRDSVIMIARDQLKLTVKERDIAYTEVCDAEEVFCTGTAAVISPIGSITCEGKEHTFNGFKPGPTTLKLYDLLTGIQTRRVKDPYEWVVPVE